MLEQVGFVIGLQLVTSGQGLLRQRLRLRGQSPTLSIFSIMLAASVRGALFESSALNNGKRLKLPSSLVSK